MADSRVLHNENIGVLGHIDAGKTALSASKSKPSEKSQTAHPPRFAAKRLSQVASTAAFDKHPQSQERGMTLDLGFSAFFAAVPKHWAPSAITEIQFTL